ncbi:MAG: hypothetical protein KDE03_05360 [Rhodobacteraceae bacterium]|nr:hypothetical protein [Paracoccaceae bacterium]
MPDASETITVTYDTAHDVRIALRNLRRYGFASPVDHLAVEAARLSLLPIPVILTIAGTIRPDQALAAYVGYFALRWFNLFARPAIMRRLGPGFGQSAGGAVEFTFGAGGLHSASKQMQLTVPWASIPPQRVRKAGVVFRIGPELAIPVSAGRLPPGWTPESFSEQVDRWRSEEAA